MGLKHVVITSVARDDLADQGANHFADCVRAIREVAPGTDVEVLIPDFRGDETALRIVLDSPIRILNHNTETVPRLYSKIRRGARYERTIELLSRAKTLRSNVLTKSGLMLGLGETMEEVYEVLQDLRKASCDILTLGQYLRPTADQHPVIRYLTPVEFRAWKDAAMELGFRHVESGPLVRSSYHAWEHV
jgi:lipoic acid synthetase